MTINSQGRISLRRAGTKATTISSSSSSPLRLSSSLSLSLAPPLNSKPSTLPLALLALLLLLQLPLSTSATPLQQPTSNRSPTLFLPRANDGASSSSSGGGAGPNIAYIVAPIAVAIIVLVLLLVMSVRRRPKWKAYFKRAFRGDVLSMVPEERAMTSTANSTPATTGGAASAAGTGATIATGLGVGGREQTEIERQRAIVLTDARRNQRAERARRQGSQRSVKSLPVYRQELDDAEMVLVKGDDQLQDDEIESPRSSHDLEDYPRGSRSHDEDPELDPPTSAPLLSNDGRPSNEPDSPTQLTSHINVIPSSAPASATRFDARSASVSTMDTFRQDGGGGGGSSDGGSHADLIHHGWGEAPSYDVESYNSGGGGGREEIIISGASTPSRLEEGVASGSGGGGPSEVNRRQSGFSRFFTRKPSAAAGSSSSTGPTSYPPLPSSTQPLSTASGSRSTHRPSFSGSSSTLNLPFGNSSLSLLHPVSTRRSSDATRLTSPSLLSISAPLTDTLVKTNFTTPSSGLSAEQMKFISSTENLGKYAVPYGPSSTRRSMDSRRRSGEEEAPPPAFDDSSDTSPRIDGLPSTFSPYPTPSPEATSSGLPSSSTPPLPSTEATPSTSTSSLEPTSTTEPTPPTSPTATTPYPPVAVPETNPEAPTTTTITFSPALSVIPATPITPVSGSPHSAA